MIVQIFNIYSTRHFWLIYIIRYFLSVLLQVYTTLCWNIFKSSSLIIQLSQKYAYKLEINEFQLKTFATAFLKTVFYQLFDKIYIKILYKQNQNHYIHKRKHIQDVHLQNSKISNNTLTYKIIRKYIEATHRI